MVVGRPVSRVLSGECRRFTGEPFFPSTPAWAIIYLGPTSPWGSCSLPRAQRGRAAPRSQASFTPAWPCSRWRLPGRRHCCRRRWSLTPPFHPYRVPSRRFWELAIRSLRRSFSVVLCAGFPARELPGIVLFGARTFLVLHAQLAIARPTHGSIVPYPPLLFVFDFNNGIPTMIWIIR